VGESSSMGDDTDSVVAYADLHSVVGTRLAEVVDIHRHMYQAVEGGGRYVEVVDEMAAHLEQPDCMGQPAKIQMAGVTLVGLAYSPCSASC